MAIEEQHMSILMTDHPCSSEANAFSGVSKLAGSTRIGPKTPTSLKD